MVTNIFILKSTFLALSVNVANMRMLVEEEPDVQLCCILSTWQVGKRRAAI